MNSPRSSILIEVPGNEQAKDEEVINALRKRFIGYEIIARKSADEKYRPVEVYVAEGDGVIDMKGNELSGHATLLAVQEAIYKMTGHAL